MRRTSLGFYDGVDPHEALAEEAELSPSIGVVEEFPTIGEPVRARVGGVFIGEDSAPTISYEL